MPIRDGKSNNEHILINRFFVPNGQTSNLVANFDAQSFGRTLTFNVFAVVGLTIDFKVTQILQNSIPGSQGAVPVDESQIIGSLSDLDRTTRDAPVPTDTIGFIGIQRFLIIEATLEAIGLGDAEVIIYAVGGVDVAPGDN